MKQVYWDSVPEENLSHTVWGLATMDEMHIAQILKSAGALELMAEDFKARPTVANLNGKLHY